MKVTNYTLPKVDLGKILYIIVASEEIVVCVGILVLIHIAAVLSKASCVVYVILLRTNTQYETCVKKYVLK